VSDGRALVLRSIGEEEFTRQMKRWALRYGWCGYHVRYSQAVVEGVHTLRNSDHSDAFGMPDWVLAKSGQPLLLPELKTSSGRLSKDQQRWLALLNASSGVLAPVWRPDMEHEVRSVLG
jgi:hypothetical protein